MLTKYQTTNLHPENLGGLKKEAVSHEAASFIWNETDLFCYPLKIHSTISIILNGTLMIDS
jgi:hypothetical protein